ncbi:hypothetical protein FIBSPDRAFT_883623 [Athelia psychrophila]|uniref:Uncharacterized protein n=1 Tax=Athelia psychrophila TaxID=1759441 RepID=A0A166TR24_9AGAM|nr:hypothetical protein FIBSPDRAFT_883623 [Fibularhizoctonia sp. CBS 109695]
MSKILASEFGNETGQRTGKKTVQDQYKRYHRSPGTIPLPLVVNEVQFVNVESIYSAILACKNPRKSWAPQAHISDDQARGVPYFGRNHEPGNSDLRMISRQPFPHYIHPQISVSPFKGQHWSDVLPLEDQDAQNQVMMKRSPGTLDDLRHYGVVSWTMSRAGGDSKLDHKDWRLVHGMIKINQSGPQRLEPGGLWVVLWERRKRVILGKLGLGRTRTRDLHLDVLLLRRPPMSTLPNQLISLLDNILRKQDTPAQQFEQLQVVVAHSQTRKFE